MVKTKHNIIAICILGIALAIVIVVIGGVSWRRASAPVRQSPTAENNTPSTATSTASSTLAARVFTPHPPHGSVTYQVAQAATQLPGFVQATIDPVDVHAGQVQHFTIVTDDPNPIVSVVAQITTDHKTITVPLVSQGAPSVSMLVPRTVTVGADNKLALVTPGQGDANADAANIKQGANVANAATANDTKFTGQWTVEDTHTAKYQTEFIAKDSAGNTNSVTLQWTDPCPFASVNNYAGGTATVSGNCDMSSVAPGLSAVDGPEHGNLTVSGATLQIDNGATLVMNNGYSINFSGGGSILILSGANIVFNQDMCGLDNDGDGYISGLSWTAKASCGGIIVMIPRANFSGSLSFNDCDDMDANVHPGQAGWFTNISAGGTWDYNCDGTVTQQKTTIGSITTIGGCSANACTRAVLTMGWAGSVPACGVTAGLVDLNPEGPLCGRTIQINCSVAQAGVDDATQSCQ